MRMKDWASTQQAHTLQERVGHVRECIHQRSKHSARVAVPAAGHAPHFEAIPRRRPRARQRSPACHPGATSVSISEYDPIYHKYVHCKQTIMPCIFPCSASGCAVHRAFHTANAKAIRPCRADRQVPG